jgi:ribose transport system substrate-binding protein
METTALAPERKSRRRKLRTLALGVIITCTAACASCSTSEPSPIEASSASSPFNLPAFLAANQRLVNANFKGNASALPSSSPRPTPGENVWIISCGQLTAGCATPANAAYAAGKLIGWHMTLFDGKLNPQTWHEGIRQAIAAHANAILLDVVDCDAVRGSLLEAHAAGVKIFADGSYDCNDTSPGASPLFDAQVELGSQYPSYGAWVRALGATVADWMIAITQGKARVIEFTENDVSVVRDVSAGFDARLAQCKTCRVLAKPQVTLSDLGTDLQQKAATVLAQYPQANAVFGMYDAAIQLGIGQAVVASGRKDSLAVTGLECYAANVTLIREDRGQDMCAGYPNAWTGWAAIDGINRLLHGQPQVEAGIGWRNIDATHNMPPTAQDYDGTEDYRANYKKIWGLTS